MKFLVVHRRDGETHVRVDEIVTITSDGSGCRIDLRCGKNVYSRDPLWRVRERLEKIGEEPEPREE